MFPSIDKNMKLKQSTPSLPQNFDKVVAENTSKMVEILQSVVRSNENLNNKTDRLLAVSEHMMTISQNMARVSEQMMALNEENIKWLKRLDKRMYYMNQSLAGQANPDFRQQKSNQKQFEKQQSPEKPQFRKPQSKYQTRDQRVKLFDQTSHDPVILRKQSELSKTSRLVIPFSSVYTEEIRDGTADVNKLKVEISTWVGQLFRQITSNIYERYITSIYSEEEARLIYCESVILNTLSVMSWFREHNKSFWNKERYTILNYVNSCAKKILGFLKVKVPRNKKNFKSVEFQNLVQRINNSEDPRYDIIKNSGISFKVKEGKEIHYVRQIKLLFNKLITQVQKQFPNFSKKMVKVFLGDEESKGKFKYLIGKKFKDNIPLFSEQQLNTLSFKCKSPQILRILIKWLQEMEDMIKSPQQYIEKKKVFKDVSQKKKDPVPISQKIKKQVVKQIQVSSTKLKQKFNDVKDILLDLIDNVSQLVAIKPQSSEYLDHEDIKAIKFSQLISQSLPFLAVARIQMIVQVCRSFQKDNKSGLLQFVDLLTFSVFDLLRSKCIGNKAQIQAVYNRLKSDPYFQLIRVKNRLDTPLNDILINCKIKGSPLICEVQLLITNESITEKSEKNEHFNHFLYELQRSKFGPLCEACIIINDSDPRMQYINQLKKIKMKLAPLSKQQQQNLDLVGDIKKCYNNHTLKVLHFSIPFICTLCSMFYKQYSSSFNSYYCEECNFVICPSCFLDKLKDDDKKDNYLLKNDTIRRVFFKDKIYELKNYKKQKLEQIIISILQSTKSEYCMIISYTQGVVTKKGYKLVADTIFPTYFTMTKKPAKLDDFDKYDILVLFKQDQIQSVSPKMLVKAGDVQFTNSFLTRQMVQQFATKQSCNLKCIKDDNAILVIDFEQDNSKIEEVMKQLKFQKTIQDCKSSKITTLNMSSSQLSDISILKTEANSLSHVLTVVADDNNITTLQPFWELQNLKKLSLKDNKIKDYQQIIIPNQNFIDLFLAVNEFTFFPLIKAPQMTRISFKRNKIRSIDKLTQSELPKLNELGLAQNQIQTIPLMKLPMIKKIVLDKNQIADISILNQCQIQTVQILNLEQNLIVQIPELNLPNLKEMILTKNKIRDISKFTTSNLSSLKSLNMAQNQLNDFPELSIPSLEVLNLSGNKLQSLNNINNDLFPILLDLNLCQNKLKAVPQMNFPLLTQLNLSNNQISKLSLEHDGKITHFFNSNLPSISKLSLALKNKFLVKQLILMQMDRWFTSAKYLE